MVEKKSNNRNIQVLQIIDSILVLCAMVSASLLWNVLLADIVKSWGYFKVSGTDLSSFGKYGSWLYLAVPFIPVSLEAFGFYEKYGQRTLMSAMSKILKAHATVIIAYALLAVLLKLETHRPTLVIGCVSSMVFISVREWLLMRRYKERLKTGKGKIRTMLMGARLKNEWWDAQDESTKNKYDIQVHHDLDNDDLDVLRKHLSDHAIEQVIVFTRNRNFNLISKAIEECEIQGVEVWLASDFVRARICQPSFDMIGNTPMLVLKSTPSLTWSLLMKDIMDRVGAALLILATSPLWLLAIIGIKLKSPGPIFYKQERAGKYGNPFWIWKFRTMDVDADKKLEALKSEMGNQMSGPVFKLENDPRITKFGAFMRRTSIDELPQLLNVLFGEMSLVGPRPMAMYELPEIEKSEHRRKLSVKPGITCIWQVEGRNSITDFDEWVALDLKYIDNWSIWLDIKLLLKTVPAVLFSKGAS